MKKIYCLLSLSLVTLFSNAQCPKIIAAMIDACNGTGFEGDNEFIVAKNGSNELLASNISIYYGSNNPPSSGTGAAKVSFTNLTSTYTAAMNSFISQLNVTAGLAGCPNLVATAIPPAGIPANATFFIFSPLVTQSYDLHTFCTSAPLYILFDTYFNVVNGCTGLTAASGTNQIGFNRCGTFKNFGSGATNNNRYFSIQTNAAGGSCAADIVSYDFTALMPQPGVTPANYDGSFVSWSNSTVAYSNDGCTSIIVPVTLTDFMVNYNNDRAILSWQTATELNTRCFEIEKSYDGNTFSRISTIAAAGNSSVQRTYGMQDKITRFCATYYRLKIIELNGNVKFSKVIKINPSKNGFGINNIYPQPARDKVTIEWNSVTNSNLTMTVMDITGKLISAQTLQSRRGFNQHSLDISALAHGRYILKTISGDDVSTDSFTK